MPKKRTVVPKALYCFLGIIIFSLLLPIFCLKESLGDEMYINDSQLEKFEKGRMRDIVVEMNNSNKHFVTDQEVNAAAELMLGRKKSKWFDSIPEVNLVSRISAQGDIL